MGMDVYGKAPANKTGEYFRNNCWWWRPLWQYCEWEARDLAAKVKNAQSNDGDGLGAEDSLALAKALRSALADGRTAKYVETYRQAMESLPMEKCVHCHGNGIRNDRYVKGPCNACYGAGKVKHFGTHYPFSAENVEQFADFLESCGGFEIN